MIDSFKAMDDARKADPNGPWKKGPSISADDLKRGKGLVQHISAAEALGRTAAKNENAKTNPIGDMMGFGKYRDRTASWVQAEDPRYFEWACQEVSGFRKRAEKMGLFDNDSDDGDELDEGDGDAMTVNR